ncbi:ribosome maturation factor RimP [Exiguobacterium oxidotolerans]|uniref:Ribosome maturation factor RimP n=1 Tax=Exiguobacterium oxidotolerans TaxID=223958 RepID=A0A653IDZ4_9BACL|nr:ribosome maturation factor RimP [Exiguobacterium oxidotolerans]VWX36908.1 ribosome maturation factor [Exiguobacterium oxidotolerans]
MTNVTEKVEALAKPIVEREGMELVDVEFVKEGADWFLRVSIDKEGGVDLEDCVNINEQLSEALNNDDPIDEPYYLDVASPGAERPLKKAEDFEKAIGKHIYVKTNDPVKDATEFEGTLLAYNDEMLEIEVRVKTRKLKIEIPVIKIAMARLAVMF